MYDRIREIAEQADLFADSKLQMKGEFHPDWHDIRDQKFAELIIKECGKTLVDNTPAVELVEDWDRGYDRAVNDCILLLYKHFGIEE